MGPSGRGDPDQGPEHGHPHGRGRGRLGRPCPGDAGGLRVGPRSAGADPGPASYGGGGTEPTVTDANVSRRMPPRLLGGEMGLDVDAARGVQEVGKPSGSRSARAAEGILGVVNANMAGALRLCRSRSGYDPRDFAIVAFGGAGPLHANAVAKVMGSSCTR